MQYYVTEITSEYACHTIKVSFFEQNCRIIWNKHSKKGVLIDPGVDLPIILETIKKHEVDITKIWITHGHIDHAAEALDAAQQLNVDIFGPHIGDKDLVGNMQEYVQAMKIDVPTYEYFANAKNYIPSKWLEEGDLLDIDGLEFEVLFMPGHSPGHVAFYSKQANCLISGDVVFYNSVGRTDLKSSCQQTLKKSIIEKLLPLPDDTLILAGHGQDFTLGEVRNSNVFLIKWAKNR